MYLNLANIKSKEILPGFKGKFVHTKQFTIAHWEIDAKCELPEHKHVHEQTTHLIEGKMEFTIGGKTQILKSGDIAIIPSNIVHKGKALTKCFVTDVFCPVREDYK